MKKILVIIFMFLICNSYAQDEWAGTESLFSNGFGARAKSLGNAFTSVADDPTAVFWNPAGLEHVYQQSVSIYHMSLYEGTLYDFLGFAYPTLHLGTFGLGVARIGVGDVPHTGEFNEDLGVISHELYHGYFSYAKKLPWDLSAGATINVVHRMWTNLDGERDTGVGVDLGFLYKPQIFSSVWLRDWSVGLSLQNLLAPKINEGVGTDQYPFTARMGFSRKLYLFDGGNQLHILFDANYSPDRDTQFHLGTEYRFRDLGMLRLGFDGFHPTFGAGMQYSIFQIDYAFGQPVESSYWPPVHRFSVTFNFGMNRDQLYTLAVAERQAEEERLIADIREADRQKFIAEHIQFADQYFEEGKYLDAIVEYQQVIGQDAFNKRATVMLDSAEVVFQNQRNQEQTLAIQTALDSERAESNRLFIQEHFDKGRNYLEKKQFTEALIEFNLALERGPDDASTIAAIQTTRRRMSEETTRLIALGRQEFRNGNYADALNYLADARLYGGDNQAIQNEIETLSSRIRLQENIQKGMGLFEIGEYDQARTVFEEALKINPENELARQYLEKSKIETVGKTEPLSPAAEARYLQGVDRFVKGKYAEAITIWEEVLEEHPYNKKVLKALEGARERLNKSK